MQLYIDDETRIINLQHLFNTLYPYLKIDFLKNDSAKKASKAERISPNEQMKSFNNISGIHQISVNKQRTVMQLKKDFKEMFGLATEVYRKSGNVWIETSLTDDWTLEQQNKEGELICLHSKSA